MLPPRLRVTNNTFTLALWLLLATLLLAAGGLAAFLAAPDARGPGGPEMLRDEAYRFDRLRLKRGDLRLNLDAGFLVPVYRGGQVTAVLLLAPGHYTLHPPADQQLRLLDAIGRRTVEDQLESVYLSADYALFEDLRYESKARFQPMQRILDRAGRLLEERGRERLASPFAAPGWDPLNTGGGLVELRGGHLGRVSYGFGELDAITFHDLGGLTIPLHEGAAKAGGIAQVSLLLARERVPLSLATFGAVVLLLFIMAAVLTADLDTHASYRLLPDRLSWPTALLLAAALLAEGWVLYTAEAAGRPDQVPLFYGLASVLLLLRGPAGRGRPLRAHLAAGSLLPAHPLRAVTLGLLVGIIGYIGATLALPSGLDPVNQSRWATVLLRSLLLNGLAVEAYRRGFLQAVLQAVHPRWGFVASLGIIVIVHITTRLLAMPGAWGSILLDGLLVLLLSESLFAFLYQRTGSIVAGGLARGLLDAFHRLLI